MLRNPAVLPTCDQALQFGPYRIYPQQRLVLDTDQPLRLSSRALDILLVLLEQPGEVVSRQHLMSRVWPTSVVEDSNLRVHMAALRKALGDGQNGQRYIVTVAQRGYSLVAPVVRLQHSAPRVEPTEPTMASHNLPPRQARLIGRQAVVEQVLQHMHEQRLITLTGPGGIGKTCVALSIAEQLIGHYRDGIRLLDLATLSDPLRVAPQLAALLELAPDAGDPLGPLCHWLRDRHLLLVIDNCEHLIDAVAVLCEQILRSAPQVHILTTSRERLRAEGETVQRLDGLDCPPGELPEAQALGFAAVQLFLERVANGSEPVNLDAHDIALASDICRHLEGIPLAIELAAAQVAELGLQGLHQQLQNDPGLSIAARPDGTPRQQTLLTTLDWSFNLLAPGEQLCLNRLAVFKGRFALDSALAVAGDARLPGSGLSHVIGQLANKSMLNVEIDDDEVFYRLLGTTRLYALDKLRRHGELPATLERYAEHCLALMQQARDDWQRLPTRQWLARYARCLDDVREVLDWGLNGEGPRALAVSLVAHSAPLWQELSRLKEHGSYVRKALQALHQGSSRCPRLELQLRLALGNDHYHSRGPDLETVDAFVEARRLAEQAGEADGLMRAVSGHMAVNLCRGDYQAAWRQSQQFDQLNGAAANDLSARRLQVLALHYSGRQGAARQLAEEVIQSLASSGHANRFSYGFGIQYDQRVAALTVLARILWLQGELRQAQHIAHQALELALQIDHGLSVCYTLALAGCPIALYSEQPQQANERVQLLLRHAHRHSVVLFYTWAQHYARLLNLPVQPASPATGLLRDILLTLRGGPVGSEQLQRARQGEAGWCTAELLRCHAEAQADERTEGQLRQALEIARQQGAKLWELRSAISLARLCQAEGRNAESQALLVPVLAGFASDSEVPELPAARALLRGE